MTDEAIPYTTLLFKRLASEIEGLGNEAINEVFRQVREGELLPDEAFTQILEHAERDPVVLPKLAAMATSYQDAVHEGLERLKAPQPLDPNDPDVVEALTHVTDEAQTAMATMGFDIGDLLYRDHRGLVRLNPAYQAAVMERLQFDGDVPELRLGGNILAGGAPAVPVKTSARSAIAIGAMLDLASQEVAAELQADLADEERQAAIDALGAELEQIIEAHVVHQTAVAALHPPDSVTSISGELVPLALPEAGAEPHEYEPHDVQIEAWKAEANTLPAVQNLQAQLAPLLKPAETEGYKPGTLPAKREVSLPPMVSIDPAKEQQYAWSTLATTQGRASAVEPIVGLVERGLSRAGYVASVASVAREEAVVEAQWVSRLNDDAGTVNPRFSPIDVAGQALTTKLVRALRKEGVPATAVKLDVRPLAAIADRQAGWEARVSLS